MRDSSAHQRKPKLSQMTSEFTQLFKHMVSVLGGLGSKFATVHHYSTHGGGHRGQIAKAISKRRERNRVARRSRRVNQMRG